RPGTAVPIPPTVETVAPRRGGRLGIIATVAATIAGIGVAAWGLSTGDPVAPPVPQDASAPAVVAAPEPPRPVEPVRVDPPSEPSEPPAPAAVRVVLATNTPAEVYD